MMDSHVHARSASTSIRTRLSAACALALGLALAGPVSAEAGDTGYGYALAHELMSPFCPGRTLAACTSEQAAEMRQWILLQEAAGATREEVVAVLVAKHGDQLRSSPSATGWGLAAWLLPGAAVAVGAVLAFFSLRRIVGVSRRSVAASPATDRVVRPLAASNDDDLLAQLVDAEFASTRL